MKAKISISFLVFFLLTVSVLLTCVGGDHSTTNNGAVYGKNSFIGFIQKGPFIQGSSVTIYELNNDFSPTGTSYPTETVDDFGSFMLKSKLDKNYVDIHTTGFYFDEILGESSSANLTLRTMSTLKNEINVNILTTLERERIKYLIEQEGMNYKDAQNQSELEILKIFNIKEKYLPKELYTFDSMDISKTGDSNAILLAISVMLQGDNSVAELSALISKIIADIKKDASLDDEKLINELKNNSVYISGEYRKGEYIGLKKIRKNIENYYIDLGLEDVIIPSFEEFVDSDADGIINKYDVIQISPQGNIGANGAVGKSMLMLDWSDSMIDGAKYSIELSTSKDFDASSIIESADNLKISEYAVESILDTYTDYYWRVMIIEDGKKMDWCGTEQFIIKASEWVKLNPEIDNEDNFLPRAAHGMTHTENGKLIMFGGSAIGDGYLGDTWEYNAKTNTWTELFPEFDNTEDIKRTAGAMVYVEQDQIIYFGGFDGDAYYYDTLLYDINKNTWTKLNPEYKSENRLSPRSLPSMTYIGDRKVLMHGGMYEYWGRDDTWVYDVDENTWTEIFPEVIGGEFGERQLCSITYTGNGKVIFFGGFYSGTYYDELWEYDINKNTLTKLEAEVMGSELEGRNTHSMTYVGNNKLIMFGGRSQNHHFWQTWELDLNKMEWRKVSSADKLYPEISHYAQLSYIGNGKIIMFGGVKNRISSDETWLFYVE